MKIRKGFVSNSSSSSFIVAVKNGTLKSVLNSMNKEMKYKLKGFPFTEILDDVFQTILTHAEEVENVINENWNGDSNEYWEENNVAKKLLDDGYKIYEVQVSSDEYEDMSMYLYEHAYDMKYKSEDGNLVIKSR